jgi:drug/metabolite transporter (DMT)-like permease
MTMKKTIPKSNTKQILLLHSSILIFSTTGIFSKLAAININNNGVFHIWTFIFAGLMLFDCGIYALFWQKNLKHFEMNVAYAHRSIYNVWSLLWAVVIFSEEITLGNVVGTSLIIIGVLVIQNE